MHRPLPAQQHPPAPRTAFPAVPQALPTRHRLPAAAPESPKVRTPAWGRGSGHRAWWGQALGWAPGHMSLWDKSLGDKGKTAQQSGPIPGIPQLPAKQRLQCSLPIRDTVSESGCLEGLGSHLRVCWGGRHLTELCTPRSSLASFASFGPLHSPMWWVLVFHCTEEQLEALRS